MARVAHVLLKPIALTATRILKAGQWLRMIMRRTMAKPGDDLATSMDMCDDPVVAAILGNSPHFYSRLLSARAQRFIGWGRKWSGRRAVALAARHNAEVVLLEDGFLRSVGRRDEPLSLLVDDLGVHYDAAGPSWLEKSIATPLCANENDHAQRIMLAWRAGRVSKYNAAPEYSGTLPNDYILVVDQVRGDLSITHGAASAERFAVMLQAARTAHPQSDIVVKLHPDVFTNAAQSHFDPARLSELSRVQVIADACHPVALIAGAKAVYTVTSQIGFEALIWGKPVVTFGMPFYAGWGLTDDHLQAPCRRGLATLEQLVHAALIRYPRYYDPVARAPSTVDATIAHIALQREKRTQLAENITAVGFSTWKRRFLRPFFAGSRLRFSARRPKAGTVAVWGAKPSSGPALRVEDGFLRSVGLGADLTRPLSLVIDQLGMHYDASCPSDIETILNTQSLSHEQIARALTLRHNIISRRISKYNTGARDWRRPRTAGQVILVVGQVETDASLALGSPEVKTNLALLRHVRRMHPADYIVFKPHPDVLAGLRDFGAQMSCYVDHCDEILTSNIAPDHLFGQIDALHTMTSLMGFEALLRDVPVICHGIPFYAGWGLTKDQLKCPRRTAQLSLDALVFGALVTYPRYVDKEANCFISPEQALDALTVSLTSDSPNRIYHHLRRRLIIFGLNRKGSGR